MIDLQAAKELKEEVTNGLTGTRTCERLLESIEAVYGPLENIPDEPVPQTLNEWAERIHQCAKAKGWWDAKYPRSFGDVCMLLVTEVAEAYEERRKGRDFTVVYESPDNPGKPEGIPIELVDVLIRILDWMAHEQMDVQALVEAKYRYNLTRPYRHGNRLT